MRELPFSEPSKIIHISDIHIRTHKRHDEYKEVFENLYSKLKEVTDENTIIALLGDIVHSKTDISPELISLMFEFFGRLDEIAPTIVIPGNHDTIVGNSNRLDSITPILDNANLDNIHYLKENGLYKAGNVVFSHMSIFARNEDYILAKDISDEYTKIALYHGIVSGSKTDTGWTLEEGDVNPQAFDGFDIGLLGDIHKTQYVDSNETVLYNGSLIQQNHGENLEGHGIHVWDVNDRKAKFVNIPNDYGYTTLKIPRGSVPIVNKIPSKPRIRLKISETDPVETQRAVTDIRRLYDPEEINIDRTSSDPTLLRETDEGDWLGDVYDVSYQNELLSNHLEDVYNASDELIEKIKEINKNLNEGITKRENQNSFWTIKEFEFSNMFSYGSDNVIEFKKMNGIVGLFAENASGKSSILDAISFCLFDKCSRTNRAGEVLNNKSDKFYCKAVIEIAGNEYVIERTGKKKRDRVSVDVTFKKSTEEGFVDLSGKRRRKTNKIIEEYIGEYDDFTMTALSTQTEDNNFIDKTQAQRKDFLSRFIGIDVFERLLDRAKDEIKNVKTLVNNYEDKNLSQKIANAEENLEESNQEIERLKSNISDLEDKQENLSNQIISENKKLYDVSGYEEIDVEKAESRLESKREDLEKLEEDIKYIGIKIREKEQPLQGFEEVVDDIDQEKLENKYDDYVKKTEKIEKLSTQVENLETQKTDIKGQINHIEGHEFDPDCEYCVKRNKKDAEKLSELQNRLKSTKNEISNKEDELEDLKNSLDESIESKYNKLKNIQEKMEKISKTIDKRKMKKKDMEVEKKDLESDIQTLEQKIKNYKDVESKIDHNKEIEKNISSLKEKKDRVESEMSDVKSELERLQSKAAVAKNKIETFQEEMEEYKELRKEYNAYEYYIQSVKRDGIPYKLINKSMPQIEEEVNSILSNMVDFSLMMELDDKNVNAYIMYDEENRWALDIASNFERFISSMAIRVALTNISNLPRPTFLAIDEGFSVADKDNLNNMSLLFNYLNTQFDFVVVISHLEMMRDMVSDLIEIQSDKEFSSVRYI